MALLAVDAGRSEVEIKCETGVRAFPSAVSVAKTRNNPEYYLNSLEIHIDGEKWWVGKLAETEGKRFKRNNFSESKADPILRVQVIAAAIYAGLSQGEIDLGVLVPVDNFTPEERKAVRALLLGQHRFTYWLVEKSRTEPTAVKGEIDITRVMISQEGVAAYWSQKQEECTQTFDFGAKTINYCFHNEDQEYDNLSSGTIDDGWEIMKHMYGLRGVSDKSLPQDKVDLMAKELAQKAIDEVKLRGWSAHYKTQVFGGVADIVLPYIKQVFPRAETYPNPRNANVNGLYTILEDVLLNA